MTKLTDERLAEMRANALHYRFAGKSYLLEPEEVIGLFERIDVLVTQVRNQAAELEDTRAAYQLTRHQLDAHRAGQGTYGGSYSYQHGPIEPGPLTTEELAQTEED